MFGLSKRFVVSVAKQSETLRTFYPCISLRCNETTGHGLPLDYKVNPNETTEVKRARLLYQSRKRGMLENDLLLSTFFDKYLFQMDSELLSQYDNLINSNYSDWDIYYWVVGKEPTPKEFDNQIMSLLKEHVQNKSRERRLRQPPLPEKLINKESA